MADTIITVCHLTTIILSLFCVGVASSLHIQAVPKKFDPMTTKQINVTCEEMHSAEKIMFLKIEKDDVVIAILDADGLKNGPAMKSSIKVQGNLKGATGPRYLNLVITKPTKQDGGIYDCKMLGMDGDFRAHGYEVAVNVTHGKKNISETVASLQEMMIHLETTIQKIPKAFSDLENTISEMKQKTQAQDKTIQSNSRTLHSLMTKFDQLKSQNDIYEKKHKEEVSSKVGQLSSRIEHLGVMLQQIIDDGAYTVAFSAGFTFNTSIHDEEPLIFGDPILNLGGAFSFQNGTFRAPRRGLYVFHLVIDTEYAKQFVIVDLFKNDETPIASLTVSGAHEDDQRSVSTVVDLNPGDIVRPYVSLTNAPTLEAVDRYSMFSGFLLKLL